MFVKYDCFHRDHFLKILSVKHFRLQSVITAVFQETLILQYGFCYKLENILFISVSETNGIIIEKNSAARGKFGLVHLLLENDHNQAGAHLHYLPNCTKFVERPYSYLTERCFPTKPILGRLFFSGLTIVQI